MKHLLLLLFIIFCSIISRANDTLTRAQIYNFNVGDTFDYETQYTLAYPGSPPCIEEYDDTIAYYRYAISQVYYSQDSDTLFIVRNCVYPLAQHFDTLVLDSLNYLEVYIDTNGLHCSHASFGFNATSSYNNLPVNSVAAGCANTINFQYCPGIGAVYSSNIPLAIEESAEIMDGTSLIYYHQGTVVWGTPYTVADSSALVHFTPVPEECASWIGEGGGLIQVVRTGVSLAQNGHKYVELLLSDAGTTDSLIGYFRNDTTNQKVYYYDSYMYPTYTCDFSKPAGGFVLNIRQVNVGGQLRSFWYEDCVFDAPIGGGYIEGIGPANGFVNSQFTYDYCTYLVCGNLTCFSVCGQTLYPYDSTGNCALAAISNIEPSSPNIKLYPTPNSGQFNVEVTDQNLQNLHLVVTDITGREIKRCPLNNQLNNINIESCASGLYIWQVWDGERLVQSGKLVKE